MSASLRLAALANLRAANQDEFGETITIQNTAITGTILDDPLVEWDRLKSGGRQQGGQLLGEVRMRFATADYTGTLAKEGSRVSFRNGIRGRVANAVVLEGNDLVEVLVEGL